MKHNDQHTSSLNLALRRLGNALRPDVHILPVPNGIHAEWDVPVRVRDGVTLRINIFRPAAGKPAPVIMSAHPYGKDKISAHTHSGSGVATQYRVFPQPQSVALSSWTSWEAPDPAVWVPQGYVIINADLRGSGTSEGIGELFSDEEALDYFDLIEWAGTQPWSNGRVGLDGVSYLAISQYKTAALHPPHLAAICPWEGLSDLYRDFARPGGVREDGFSIVWSTALKHSTRMRADLRQEVVNRSERDAWYESTTPHLERIEVPMLVCGSFSDHSLHTRGSFEAFRRVGSKQKWLYTHRSGKWSTYYSKEATETRMRFFDYFLKGIDNGWDKEPAVRLAIYEAGAEPVAVVGETTWPPKDLTWTVLNLDAESRALKTNILQQNSASVSFSTNSRMSFTWTVPEDMDIIGPMALRLHIQLQGADDMLIFAGVRKFRAGVEATFEGSFGFAGDMVSKGWQRAAHRELDPQLSTREQPVHRHTHAEPLRPEEIVPIDIALLPHATRFLKGDVLRLDIRGTWHFSKNPLVGQFPSAYQGSKRATCILYTGGQYDAHLLIGHRPINVPT